MSEITREEFLARYEAGERDFTATQWTDIDLSGTILNGVQFKSTGLPRHCRAEWRNVNLRNIVWTECNLGGCDFWNCDWRDASFINCYMSGMRLFDCNLKRVQAKSSKFFECNFGGVNFRGANLGRFFHTKGHRFADCIREDGKLASGFSYDPWDSFSKTEW